MMKISEIYYALQGEGKYVGWPSILIRTSGCNLRCNFCDTPFASWGTEGKLKTVEQILAEVHKWNQVHHCIITGGEPMIQGDMPWLVDGLTSQGHFVTIETSGSYWLSKVRPNLFSISPKMSNSYPDSTKHPKEYAIHTKNNFYDSTISRFLETGIDCQFKFVVGKIKDVDEVLEFVDGHGISRNCVYLMPKGTSEAEMKRIGKVMANQCMKHGLLLTPRLHVNLYGNKRGK